MAATLTELAVLAATKDTLYSALDANAEWDAVTETQFITRKWGGWETPDDVGLTRHRAGQAVP